LHIADKKSGSKGDDIRLSFFFENKGFRVSGSIINAIDRRESMKKHHICSVFWTRETCFHKSLFIRIPTRELFSFAKIDVFYSGIFLIRCLSGKGKKDKSPRS